MTSANPKYTKREFDENKRPFGKDNDIVTFLMHRQYKKILNVIAKETDTKIYVLINNLLKNNLPGLIDRLPPEHRDKHLEVINSIPLLGDEGYPL